MKALRYFGFAFLALFLNESEASEKTLRLENGHDLIIVQIQPSRNLPHGFYDQAMLSIPAVYPNARIVAKRRIGFLSKNPSSLYSLVCYQKSSDSSKMTISGVVIKNNRAWSFAANVAESAFADTLILIMEVLMELPTKDGDRNH